MIRSMVYVGIEMMEMMEEEEEEEMKSSGGLSLTNIRMARAS